jgi:hypothetical protein
MPASSLAPITRRRSSAVLPAPGRRSCAQGRWSVAIPPVTGCTDYDRGPQEDAEERTISAHRAIEIREKRRGVLSSHPARITLALQPTSSVNDTPTAVHAISQRTHRTPRSARHRCSWARRITTYRTGGSITLCQVMVNYTALGEASPPAALRCACASIAYGVRWHAGSGRRRRQHAGASPLKLHHRYRLVLRWRAGKVGLAGSNEPGNQGRTRSRAGRTRAAGE